MTSILGYPLLLAFTILSSFISCEAKTKILPSKIHLAGSTPGDEEIKLLLGISPDTKIDFIRWNLILTNTKPIQQTFTLNINYGEAQPNTLGFKNGGEKKSIDGEFTVSKGKEIMNGELYHLKSTTLPIEILMVKLNENIFHLLTRQKQLMVGNGGWSYTLNRKQPIHTKFPLPALTVLSTDNNNTLPQIIFDGRTPCQPLANEHQMNVSTACFKLKWRLILNRDSVTGAPTTYINRKVVDNLPRDVTGKWIIIRGIQGNPDAIIYQLDPDKPTESISLLVGDENVLFFLNKEQKPYVGNSDFSFTLNKKQE